MRLTVFLICCLAMAFVLLDSSDCSTLRKRSLSSLSLLRRQKRSSRMMVTIRYKNSPRVIKFDCQLYCIRTKHGYAKRQCGPKVDEIFKCAICRIMFKCRPPLSAFS